MATIDILLNDLNTLTEKSFSMEYICVYQIDVKQLIGLVEETEGQYEQLFVDNQEVIWLGTTLGGANTIETDCELSFQASSEDPTNGEVINFYERENLANFQELLTDPVLDNILSVYDEAMINTPYLGGVCWIKEDMGWTVGCLSHQKATEPIKWFFDQLITNPEGQMSTEFLAAVVKDWDVCAVDVDRDDRG